MGARQRYWISWYQPGDDPRPLTSPPNPGVLGWWRTAIRSDGAAVLVALVECESGMSAARDVVRADWPEASDFRFCSRRSCRWRPNDRFPVEDWMVPRIEMVIDPAGVQAMREEIEDLEATVRRRNDAMVRELTSHTVPSAMYFWRLGRVRGFLRLNTKDIARIQEIVIAIDRMKKKVKP